MLATLLRAACADAGLDDVVITSAGVAAGPDQDASAQAQQVMTERGLSLADHRSQAVSQSLIDSTDLAVCMSDRHAAILVQAGMPTDKILIANAQHGGVPDPFGGPVSLYRSTATVLSQVAAHIVDQIRSRPS